jgi:hypothetical protein
MKKELDVFGMAMRDYLNGERGNVIAVDTNLTEDEELSVDYLFRSEQAMPEWEKLALEICRGKILDVGAGAGCHSKILTQRGFDVDAIDIAPLAVEYMLAQDIKAEVKNYFDVSGKYDTLLFLMNGIGLAETIDGLENVFFKAKSILNAGGQIILESSDILYMFEQEDGSYMIDINGHYYGEMEYTLSYKGVQAEPFPWLYIDFQNLSDKASLFGFESEMIYEGEEGNYLARLTLKP